MQHSFDIRRSGWWPAALAFACIGAAACGAGSADDAKGGGAADFGSTDTRTAEVLDRQLGLTAFTLKVPKDWLLDANVLRGHFGPMPVLRTSTSDGLTGFQLMPGTTWVMVTDPSMVRFYQQQNTRIGPPMSADEFIRTLVLPQVRPGATIVGNEAVVDSERFAEDDRQANARFDAAAAQSGGRANHVATSAARVRIQYDYNGHTMDEVLMANVSVTDMAALPGGGKLIEAHVGGAHAPRGKLDKLIGTVTAIGRSITVNQDWVAAQNQYALRNAQAQQQATLDMAEGYRRRNQATFEASMRNTAAMEAARHAGAIATADHMCDVQGMVNPATGAAGKVSNQYNYSYADENGNVVQTNSATYNPNADLPGNWTQLQPLKP